MPAWLEVWLRLQNAVLTWKRLPKERYKTQEPIFVFNKWEKAFNVRKGDEIIQFWDDKDLRLQNNLYWMTITNSRNVLLQGQLDALHITQKQENVNNSSTRLWRLELT